jgi:glutamate-1-semialdehyde aminotransferase
MSILAPERIDACIGGIADAVDDPWASSRYSGGTVNSSETMGAAGYTAMAEAMRDLLVHQIMNSSQQHALRVTILMRTPHVQDALAVHFVQVAVYFFVGQHGRAQQDQQRADATQYPHEWSPGFRWMVRGCLFAKKL